MPKIKDYRNLLAEQIFKTPLDELNVKEIEFVELHYTEYVAYHKRVAAAFREYLRKKKLEWHDYDKIFEYYCERIPAGSVLAGMEQGKQKAVNNNIRMFAAGYFHHHVLAHGDKFCAQVRSELHGRFEFPFDISLDLPWMFKIYSYIRDGNVSESIVFDLWCGAKHRSNDSEVT